MIAAFVCSAVAAGSNGIWLMAQSNIAVKNIAEKLAAVGFMDWRLLVSGDFHTGWYVCDLASLLLRSSEIWYRHEHIYAREINTNIIKSTEFRHARRHIEGIPVILCTLSILSHPKLHVFTAANPIKTVVVDEASQITLGQYVAPLQRFPTIHKICMIGDDKQCEFSLPSPIYYAPIFATIVPPYGADEDVNIKSIFEIEHLQPNILFLSVQCECISMCSILLPL